MDRTDCYTGQRVTAKVGTQMYFKGCREGDVYHIGEVYVCVEFDYLGMVSALDPAHIEPVLGE